VMMSGDDNDKPEDAADELDMDAADAVDTVEESPDAVVEEAAPAVSELEQARIEAGENRDRYLRAAAELSNFRKRTVKMRSETRDDTLRDVLLQIGPMLDNFRRALAQEADDIVVFRQGIEIIFKQFNEILSSYGLVEIDTDDSNNMSTGWGMVASDNFTWHGIIVMKAPSARSTTMHPAHDDYAQIWINGELVYDNDQWTGGVKTVTQPMDVDLVQGDNVVLFKCGESGGDDYINLHFEDSDSDIDIVPTEEGDFWIYAGLAVEARDKASTTWGELKAR